jgi:hypothetical protein
MASRGGAVFCASRIVPRGTIVLAITAVHAGLRSIWTCCAGDERLAYVRSRICTKLERLILRRTGQVLAIAVVLLIVGLILGGCGGTWVDDQDNFKRIFGFDKPFDVEVRHSYYWKSPHWSTEYRYYIALRGSIKFASGLTTPQVMIPAVPDTSALAVCGSDPPRWFLSKPLSHYAMWTPKNSGKYRVFRDEDDGTLYVCDEQL